MSMEIMQPNILIIGAGITSALSAARLSQRIPNLQISVWDKARGPGGRMTTSRTDDDNIFDLGAQYITTSDEYIEKYSEEYSGLLNEKIISPFTAQVDGMRPTLRETKHFIAPKGFSSVVKHFLGRSSANLTFHQHVISIVKDGNKYRVSTKSGNSEVFDVVVSTMPVPQVLSLSGIDEILGRFQPRLEEVKYSTRFVLIWLYNTVVQRKTPWVAKYMDNEIFRYVVWDSEKRNQSCENSSVVFHTSVEYGFENIKRSKEDVLQELVERAKKLFPDWPQPSSFKCHKWLYSQVTSPMKESGGCLIVTEKPTFILTGDAFTSSHFNSCIEAARSTTEAVSKALQ